MKTPLEMYRNARSWGLRNKTAKQREGCIRNLRGRTGTSSLTLPNEKLATACWHFNRAKNRHEIELGLKFVESLSADAKASERRQYQCLQALLLHEVWHGHLTERDGSMVATALREKGIPFALFNLFEDARIEHAARADASFKDSFDTGRFGWVNYYEQPEATDKPTTVFWSLINGESSAFSSLAVRCPRWTGGDWLRPDGSTIPERQVLPTIKAHFRRVIDTKSTTGLGGVLGDWLRDFGPKVERHSRGSGMVAGESDGSGPEGATPSGSGGEGTKELGGSSGHGAGGDGVTAPTELSPDAAAIPAELRNTPPGPASRLGNIKRFQNSGIKDRPLDHVDGNAVKQQTNRLADIVRRAGVAPASTGCDGRKLHLGNAITGQSNAFLRNAAERGRRKLVAIFDCSGSMGVSHLVHGRSFLLALVALHRRRVIDCDIWLTGGSERCRLNLDAVSFRDLVAVTPALGCESFRATLDAISLRELQAASAVVCYTDGQITDGAVDAGSYRNRGVNLIGCCTAPENEKRAETHAAALKHHFGRGIMKPTGEQLASALVAAITVK